MNIRTLCLAILSFRDATGYEIRKLSTEGTFSYFVEASYGAIYPALNRLEADGLVTCREEAQSGKPSRKVYSITAQGREELVRALSLPPEPDTFRSPFLLIAMCAEYLPRETVRSAIETHAEHLERELSVIRSILGDARQPSTKWVVEYGERCVSQSLNHLQETRGALEALARPERPQAEAAE